MRRRPLTRCGAAAVLLRGWDPGQEGHWQEPFNAAHLPFEVALKNGPSHCPPYPNVLTPRPHRQQHHNECCIEAVGGGILWMSEPATRPRQIELRALTAGTRRQKTNVEAIEDATENERML